MKPFCVQSVVILSSLLSSNALMQQNPTTSIRTIIPSTTRLASSRSTADDSSSHHHTHPSTRSNTETASTLLQREIDTLRSEALRRLNDLSQQIEGSSEAGTARCIAQPQQTTFTPPTPEMLVVQSESSSETTKETESVGEKKEKDASTWDEADMMEDLLEKRRERDAIHLEINEQLEHQKRHGPSNLLDGTKWRLSLNVGRETGTWMPKTWGVSGERLRLNLELDFSSEQLYERDEFLNGVSGAKVLRVTGGRGTMSPSMTEGGRDVTVKPGGWRIAQGEGPMGSSVLRFYIELDEEARHQGSDVYCPPGRIYCTCGFFPMQDHQEHMNKKASLKSDLRELEVTYQGLERENNEDSNLLSWDKVVRSKQMLNMRIEATDLKRKYREAQVREPEKSLLRLSQDQSVGLTKEGGVCCKVTKGMTMEYHILGRFEVASVKNRQLSP